MVNRRSLPWRVLAAMLLGLMLPAAGTGEQPQESSASSEPAPSQEPIQLARGAPAAPAAAPHAAGALSLDFRDAEIQMVLEALARKAGVNIVSSKEVMGLVTIHLENVTWEQALDILVKSYGYGYEKEENVIFVAALEEIKKRREALKEIEGIEPVTSKVIQLNFLDAADVKKFLEPQLSPQGKISVLEMTGQKGWDFGGAEAGGGGEEAARERRERENARSKAVVITDTPTVIDRLEKILSRIDTMPKQILIETKVMEVSRDLLRDLGLEIGTGTGSTGVTTRTFSHLTLEDKQGANRSTFGGSILNQVLSPGIFVPETTGLTAANTALSLVLRRLKGDQYEMLIRALEEDVRTNTLSAPHILTLSGQEARILVGEKYPILNTQVSGTDTTTTTTTLDYYQDIGIELYVVPQVGGSQHIDMIVHPVISTRGSTVGTNAYPILNIREAETQVIMETGETIVIGGLLKDVRSKSRVGLPFLGQLPLIGPIFSRSTTDIEKIDLLIFITARIVEPGPLSSEEMERLRDKYRELFHKQISRKPNPPRRVPLEATPAEDSEVSSRNRGYLYQKTSP